MLGRAIRHGLAGVIGRIGDETLAACIPLLVLASAYIAIDVSGRWPTDADLREPPRRGVGRPP